MQDVRIRLSSAIALAVLVGAGAFAAGRSTGGSNAVVVREPEPVSNQQLSGGEATPPSETSTALPPGHPAVDPNSTPLPVAAPETSLTWKVPARWQTVPNTSTMRIATYRIPRAPGDDAEADVSVTQAGGTVQANVDRWMGQFGPEAKGSAKQTTKKIAGLDVTIVEVEGTYNGGMGGDKAASKAALLGAIVATEGMPHFFKITGPAKTVLAARAELDALLASLATKS